MLRGATHLQQIQMFRLFRLVIFIGIVFVLEILYERNAVSKKWLAIGGQFSKGLCER